MFNRKKAEASFCRSGGLSHIKISLPEDDKPFYMHAPIDSEELGERDLNDVIVALIKQKACMLSEHNYPPVYEKMLTKLIETQNERIARYGESKEKEDEKDNKTEEKAKTKEGKKEIRNVWRYRKYRLVPGKYVFIPSDALLLKSKQGYVEWLEPSICKEVGK